MISRLALGIAASPIQAIPVVTDILGATARGTTALPDPQRPYR